MPIYMDVHLVPGVSARDVAEAHRQDLLIESEHQCKCITYWIDEGRESIFCLIEAPTKDAVNTMHGRSHGLIPNKIIEVNSKLVSSFLGRIYDPADAEVTDDGLKVFQDPSFRILLVIQPGDPALIHCKLGRERAEEWSELFYSVIRNNLASHGGREVEQKKPLCIISFTSAADAIACAVAIQQQLSNADPLDDFRIGISAGEPVASSDELFGDAIRLGDYLCRLNQRQRIVISAEVDELISKGPAARTKAKILALNHHDQSFIKNIFGNLDANWQNPDFNVAELCSAMAMSNSQLYRKTTDLTGESPVVLLKDFRLGKAKDMMRQQRYNISEITFASGFTSPSYFTKCFKKKYGLLPMAYVDLLH